MNGIKFKLCIIVLTFYLSCSVSNNNVNKYKLNELIDCFIQKSNIKNDNNYTLVFFVNNLNSLSRVTFAWIPIYNYGSTDNSYYTKYKDYYLIIDTDNPNKIYMESFKGFIQNDKFTSNNYNLSSDEGIISKSIKISELQEITCDSIKIHYVDNKKRLK